MTIRNGRCYADGGTEVLCITSAENLGGYKLRVVFNGVEERVFDGTSLFAGEVFRPLRDEGKFADFKLDYETITWLDGAADVAPEFVYEHSSTP